MLLNGRISGYLTGFENIDSYGQCSIQDFITSRGKSEKSVAHSWISSFNLYNEKKYLDFIGR
jgi:hypothetical protein